MRFFGTDCLLNCSLSLFYALIRVPLTAKEGCQARQPSPSAVHHRTGGSFQHVPPLPPNPLTQKNCMSCLSYRFLTGIPQSWHWIALFCAVCLVYVNAPDAKQRGAFLAPNAPRCFEVAGCFLPHGCEGPPDSAHPASCRMGHIVSSGDSEAERKPACQHQPSDSP